VNHETREMRANPNTEFPKAEIRPRLQEATETTEGGTEGTRTFSCSFLDG